MSAGNSIHPTAVIGPGVELGDGNVIAPYAVVLGPTRIGNGNWIGPHVSIGTPAQVRGGEHDAGWDAAPTTGAISLGDNNVIREFVTVHLPTAGGATSIGSDCYLMAYSHVPHDATIGDGATLANSVQIGGHTTIGPAANIGLATTIHQRLAIGGGSMIGMSSVVTKDIPPYSVAYGSPARVTGANVVGLRRSGYDEDVIAAIVAHIAEDPAAPLPVGLPAALVEVFASHQDAIGRRR